MPKPRKAQKEKEKSWWKDIRYPLPLQRDHFHSEKKGKKTYKRKANKEVLDQEVTEFLKNKEV